MNTEEKTLRRYQETFWWIWWVKSLDLSETESPCLHDLKVAQCWKNELKLHFWFNNYLIPIMCGKWSGTSWTAVNIFLKYAGIIKDWFAAVATETTHADQVLDSRIICHLKKQNNGQGRHQKMYRFHVFWSHMKWDKQIFKDLTSVFMKPDHLMWP